MTFNNEIKLDASKKYTKGKYIRKEQKHPRSMDLKLDKKKFKTIVEKE